MPYEAVNIAPKPSLAAAPQNGSVLGARPPIPSVHLPSRRATKLAARRSNGRQQSHPPERADEEIVRQNVLALHRPSSNLILRGEDGLYFQLFRTHTARELSGFFDSVFWTQTVLRECHYEDAIRHAVIALGALYKTLEQSSASPPAPPRAVIPPRFGTLLEARLAWDTLCETMLRFTETLFARSSGDGPMGILPRALKQYGAGFKARLDSWSAAFAHILDNRFGPNVSAQEKAGIAVLKMFQVMGQLLFLMTVHDSEAAFDAFSPQFALIVDLATEVVGDEERRAAAKRCPDPSRCVHRTLAGDFMGASEHFRAFHVKPSFSADLGIVPPLYVVATKCRDSVIRRRAIQLLRSSSRREGMWDSQLSGLIGEWVASIEEEPLPGGEAPSPEWGAVRHVPADRRVMVYSVDFDLRSRFARLSVGTRGITGTSPDARARETSIAW